MDLTKGPIQRQLIKLALPLIIGSLLQQLFNMVDAVVIGRFMGQEAFAAIGVAGTLMNLFYFVLTGGCVGISVVLGQLYGEKNFSSFRNAFFMALIFGVLLTMALAIICTLGLDLLMDWISTPYAVAHYSHVYLTIILTGLVLTYLYNLFTAVLRACGNTTIPLWILTASVVLNTLLDFLFVGPLQMGIAGAAYATVLSQLAAALLCFLYLRMAMPKILFRRSDVYVNKPLLKRTLHYGLVSAFHQSSLYIGRLLVQGAVNPFGVDMIAAYTASTRIEGFFNSFGDSGAGAISIFTAQNKGARDRQRIEKGLRSAIGIMFGLGAASSVMLLGLSKFATDWVIPKGSQAVHTEGMAYLGTIAFFYILCFMGNTFMGYFRGLGWVNVPVIGTLLQMTLRIILSYLLIGRMGLQAVAVATGIGWVLIVLYQVILLVTTRPRQHETIAGAYEI